MDLRQNKEHLTKIIFFKEHYVSFEEHKEHEKQNIIPGFNDIALI